MILDLSGITTEHALHKLFKTHLGFPDFYGHNWDAFRDSIRGLVEMPDELVLVNWHAYAQACPKGMAILQEIIQDYPLDMPGKQIILA
ncbi:barstar family protein [Hymenobacter sp. DG01]|uniref:barstar family protein n=1 Tax=Hymenobacter sp. DG01 TaxID=2584940 RepID=UPI001123718B|nr:barstar family protein [Hymenobacter sp. DG01]